MSNFSVFAVTSSGKCKTNILGHRMFCKYNSVTLLNIVKYRSSIPFGNIDTWNSNLWLKMISKKNRRNCSNKTMAQIIIYVKQVFNANRDKDIVRMKMFVVSKISLQVYIARCEVFAYRRLSMETINTNLQSVQLRVEIWDSGSQAVIARVAPTRKIYKDRERHQKP